MDVRSGARRLRTVTVAVMVAGALLTGCGSDGDGQDSDAGSSSGGDAEAGGGDDTDDGGSDTCESEVTSAPDRSVLTTAAAVEQGFADAGADQSITEVVYDDSSPSLVKCDAVFGPGEYLDGAGQAEVAGLAMSPDYDYLQGLGSPGQFECVNFSEDPAAEVDDTSAECTDGDLIVGVRLIAPDGETVTAEQAEAIGLAVAAENAG